jgi:hypothetical protein
LQMVVGAVGIRGSSVVEEHDVRSTFYELSLINRVAFSVVCAF